MTAKSQEKNRENALELIKSRCEGQTKQRKSRGRQTGGDFSSTVRYFTGRCISGHLGQQKSPN